MTVSTPSDRDPFRGRLFRLVGLFSVIALGCGNAVDKNYPGYASDSTTATTVGKAIGAGGSSAAGAGSGGTNTGFDAGDDGANGMGGSGGAGSSSDGGAVVGARCNPSIDWAPIGRIDSIPSDNFARFGAVASDELTMAWTIASGDAYVADRATVAASFELPVKVNGTIALAVDRVALAPTGASLMAVRADRAGMLGFERSGRPGTWAPSSGLEFTQLRVTMEAGAQVFEPVLGADKRSLFFVLARHKQAPVLYESDWDAGRGSWGRPTP